MTTEESYELIDIVNIKPNAKHNCNYHLIVNIITKKSILKLKIASQCGISFYIISDNNYIEIDPFCSLNRFLKECVENHNKKFAVIQKYR